MKHFNYLEYSNYGWEGFHMGAFLKIPKIQKNEKKTENMDELGTHSNGVTELQAFHGWKTLQNIIF